MAILLGIETSCDETGVAFVRDGRDILGNITYSQVRLHKKFGGVVPEIASRRHLEVLPMLLRNLISETGKPLKRIDAVSVTTGPGLVGSLLIGLNFAKALSYSLNKPLISVNHIHAHIYSNFLEEPGLERACPHIALVVSGGHTLLFFIKNIFEYEFLGGTLDDACGETFDKVAMALGLSYPGGPAIEKAAAGGNPKAFNFPRVLLSPDSLDFSFSGLKTAVVRLWKEKKSRLKIPDIASSFQEAVVETLFQKVLRAVKLRTADSILVAGGVASNGRLRRYFREMSKKHSLSFFSPAKSLCLDNAGMVAGIGYCHYLRKDFAPLTINAGPDYNYAS